VSQSTKVYALRAEGPGPRIESMVRPERPVVLADERSVRVSAGAPGSRPQPSGEILAARAGCQKPVKEQGARERAPISSERCSHVIFSAERCFERAEPVMSRRRQQTAVETGATVGPFRGIGRWHVSREERGTGETLPGSQVGQRTVRIKPEGGKRTEPGGSPRGS